MTTKLYNQDSFLIKFTANIISSKPHEDNFLTVLDRTCFYPEGGGQPSDIGTINGVKVSYVFEKDGEIFHVTEKQFSIGENICGEIDFEKRFQYMQIHSAEHILSGYFQRKHNLKNVGFHIGKEFNTIDLDGETDETLIESAEQCVNEKIYQNIPVKAIFPSEDELKNLTLRKAIETEEELRVVCIDDCDTCACCGMHVKNTGEIGLFKIISAKRYKKGTRITFLAGKQALKDYTEKHNIITYLCEKFALSHERLTEHIEKYISDFSNLKAEYSKLQKELNILKIPEMMGKIKTINSIPLICEEIDGLPLNELRQFASELINQKEVLVILFSNSENGIVYVITKHENINADLPKICTLLNNEFTGKGGGSGKICQGTLKSGSTSDIKEKIKSAL